ncbi:MAG: TrmH family RNA methyltransferase [Bacteroidota bacterium]
MISKNRLKVIRLLRDRKRREASGKFLVEGIRAVEEAAASDWVIESVLYLSGFRDKEESATSGLLTSLFERGALLYEVTEAELSQISDVVTAQGIVAVVQQRRATEEEIFRRKSAIPVLVACDAIREPGNVGAIIRAADWFGAQGVILGKGTVELFNPKVVRSTVGSLFHIPIVEKTDLLRFFSKLRTEGYAIAAADQRGEISLSESRFAGPVALVLGNEAWGVSSEILSEADIRIAIPRFGQAESLNVTAAASIFLWHLAIHFRQ